METNFNISEEINSGVTFPSKTLNVFLYLGIIGAFFGIFPYLYTDKIGLPIDAISAIGEFVSTLAEVVFISLIAYKLYKDGVTKPSYLYPACYAGLLVFDEIVSLISEEVGAITYILVLIGGIGLGIVFLTGASTKKIGMWTLLSLAGAILMLAIIRNGFESTNKGALIGICLIYLYPYARYLDSCQKFLSEQQEDKEVIINNK